MRIAALLLALLGSPATAQVAPVDNDPDARAARALAILTPVDEAGDWIARCAGFVEAAWMVGHHLDILSDHGIVASWPAHLASPFAWTEEEPASDWRFRDLGENPNYGQLYLDAFRGIHWTVANLPIYQRDKATCLSLIEEAKR